MRGFNYKKAVQSLNYFATKSGGSLNKMKAIKLIWLADRLHLRKYGRSITGDEYYALPNGPVPSATRDILESSDFLNDIASEYAEQFLSSNGKYEYKTINEINENVFSQTDIEILETIFTNYGELDQFQLRDLSHLFPEWGKYKSALDQKLSSRFPINPIDFFINYQDGYSLFIDNNEDIDITKQLFTESLNISAIL